MRKIFFNSYSFRLTNLFLSFVLVSCGSITGLVEKSGRLLEGKTFQYKTNTRWKPLTASGLDLKNITWKDGAAEIVFSTPEIPFVTFYGTSPENDGVFYITRTFFLAGNYGGWHEFNIETSGKGRIRQLGNNNVAFTVFGNIDLLTIMNGKIRRENTRLTENRALEELLNRNERIIALVDWMKNYAAENKTPGFAGSEEFEKYWQVILFPKNPALAASLPEELRMLREAGALDADWNEAVSWIYLYYDWEKMIRVLNKEVVLTKE
jgi:hypothetical protein